MGCSCQSKKANPEYKDIYDFFSQMYRTSSFSFSINNYNSLKEQITKRSANNFKKLERKQDVRLGFIRQVTKLFMPKSGDNNKEDHVYRQNINKLLFFIIVLHITLNKFLEESEGTLSLEQQNDIEQSLISISVNSLNKQYVPVSNLGLITFYFTKLLTSLIQPMKEIENYLSLEKYTTFIKAIQDCKAVKDEEKVTFNVAIGLFCGRFFTKSKISILKKTVAFTIDFLIQALFALGDFIIANYRNIIDNEESSGNYAAFKSLCFDLFSVLQSETRDVSLGKSYLNEMEAAIKRLFTKPDDYNKVMELVLIEMFRHCSSAINKILITALLEFISDKITKNISLRFFYDILCSYCQLIVTDEILNERCMRLFAMIFIEEIRIEAKSTVSEGVLRENMFIDRLCESIFNNLGSQKMFFSFLLSVSNEYKEADEGEIALEEEVPPLHMNVQYNALNKLTSIIDKYFQTWEPRAKEDFSVKDFFLLLRKFLANDKRLRTIYAKFYEALMNFAIRCFNMNFKEFPDRKAVLNAIVSFVYDYEILTLNGENLVSDIISLMATLQSFITHYSKGSFQDAYLLFRLLALVFRQYSKEVNATFTHSAVFLVYQIGLGVLSIMKNVLQLPFSLAVIHTEVTTGVASISAVLSHKLNDVMTSYPAESEAFYSELKAKIATNYKRGSPTVSYELFSQLIDLIYSKVFGYSSSINSFFEGEMKSRGLTHFIKEINEECALWEGMGVLKRKETEIITEGNITVLFDNADELNDFSDHFAADEKIVTTNRESFYLTEAPEGINKPNALKPMKVVGSFQMGDIDNYFQDNNSTNKIAKIKL